MEYFWARLRGEIGKKWFRKWGWAERDLVILLLVGGVAASNGSAGINIWGYQCEVNSSVGARSYVKTDGATVTTEGDVVYLTSSSINAARGTVFVKARRPYDLSFANYYPHVLVLCSAVGYNGITDYVAIKGNYSPASEMVTFNTWVPIKGISETISSFTVGSAIAKDTYFNIMARYGPTSMGAKLNTDTLMVNTYNGSPGGLYRMYIGGSVNSGLEFSGYISRIMYWNVSLTPAQLNEVSVI